MENVRIRVRLNRDRISHPHVRQILLINIYQHPHIAGIGNHKTLCGSGLDQLPYRHVLFDHLAGNGRPDRDLERGRRFHQRIWIGNSQHLQRGLGGRQISARLHFGRFRLFQILLGDGMVLVQIFRSRGCLLRQNVRSLCLQVIRAELGKVGTRDV